MLISRIPVCRFTSALDVMGTYAFGIYIGHFLVVSTIPLSASIPGYVLTFGCTVILAGIIRHAVEIPMIAYGRKINKRYFPIGGTPVESEETMPMIIQVTNPATAVAALT